MEWMTMPLKRYAEFSGRSRRKEYWMWTLFILLAYVAFFIVLMALGGSAYMGMISGSSSGLGAAGGAALIIVGLFFIFLLAILIPALAVTVRRLHDTNRSGWWMLLPLAAYPIQIIGAVTQSSALALVGSLVGLGLGILLLVWYCTDGTPGPNGYGPDPKVRDGMESLAY